ncbi:UMP kinase [Treponema sp. TIM-1]|uniref:UMP kinase n=1 Tax=Treponema sp. TIM-1 TaxID=2898417 RepID=UPI00398170E3
MITVISLGGSIVAPDGVDEKFLKDFVSLIGEFLREDEKRRFILVVGGGGPARAWQQSYRRISTAVMAEAADWIGVMATRLNAQLVKAVMGEWCTQEVVTDPSRVGPLVGRVLVAAGWKPGFSSDYDAVLLAERFQADKVINLSNIEQVYSDDPRTNPEAKPLTALSWTEFRALVGDEWVPGKNVPFDPVASRHGAKIGLTVICAGGRNLENLKKILREEDFLGTTIHP